jgi:hypothetical protein
MADQEQTPQAESTQVEQAPQQEQPTEKVFKQTDVDGIVKDRLGRQQAKLAADFEKKLEAALAEKDAALEAVIQQRVDSALADRALADTKANLAAEYGLSEAQLARLQGDTPETLREDALAVFGPLKKQAPILPTGDGTKPKTAPVDDLEAKVLAGLGRLK